MNCQIIGGPVCAADAFYPAVRRLYLAIPTVLSVMRHLISHMLPEAHAVGYDADLEHE